MKKRTLALVLTLALTLALLSGCAAWNYSKGSSVEKSSVADGGYYDYPIPEPDYERYYDDEMYEAAAEAGYSNYSNGVNTANLSADIPDTAEQNPAKLIYTAEIDMETLEFETAVNALDKLTSENGGYYESSYVNDSGSYRYAGFTVRVPAENYRAFLNGVAGDQCHVLSQREYTEDVSENYYDTAGRVETQKTKLGRLQELLAEAKKMDDIIVLENAISETEELIDRLSGKLRHYDALVDYSTVTISLREVKVYEPEPDPTFGTRMGLAFSDGLKGFAEGMENILVALAYSWLWLVLIVVVVAVVLVLTRKRRLARRRERAERKAQRQARAAQPAVYSVPASDTDESKTE